MAAELVTVRCSSCREPFQVTASALGKSVRCPLCGAISVAEAAPMGLPVGEVAEEPLSLDDAEPLPPREPSPPPPPDQPRTKTRIQFKPLAISLLLTGLAVGLVLLVDWLMTSSWEKIEFEPPGGDCAILMPSEPIEQPVDLTERPHVKSATRFVAEQSRWFTTTTYTLGWLDMVEQALSYTTIEQIAKRDRTSRGVDEAATVEAQGVVRLGPRDGKEYQLKAGETTIIERLIVAGTEKKPRIYILTVSGPDLSADSEGVRRFFNSFHLK